MENNFFYCTNCGSKYSEGTKFCSECGKNLNEVVGENSNIDGKRFQSKGSTKCILAIIGIVIGIAIGTAIGYGITPSPYNEKPTFNEVITMRRNNGIYNIYAEDKIDPDSISGWACKKGRTYIFTFALICGTSGGFIGAKLVKE